MSLNTHIKFTSMYHQRTYLIFPKPFSTEYQFLKRVNLLQPNVLINTTNGSPDRWQNPQPKFRSILQFVTSAINGWAEHGPHPGKVAVQPQIKQNLPFSTDYCYLSNTLISCTIKTYWSPGYSMYFVPFTFFLKGLLLLIFFVQTAFFLSLAIPWVTDLDDSL